MDLDSDLENAPNGLKPSGAPPAYDPPRGSSGANLRDVSPLPAPVPQKPMPFPRESLEGETIFALGEEDKDSDDEDEDGDGDERSRLTGRKME